MIKHPGLAIAIMNKAPKEESEGSCSEEQESVADEMLSAIKDGNAKDFAAAMQSFISLCNEEESEESEEESEDSEESEE